MIKLSETRDNAGKIIPEKLDQFIKDHDSEKGDTDQVNRTLKAMAQTSKATREASKKGSRGG